MKTHSTTIQLLAIAALSAACALSGCSAQSTVVRTGDTVNVGFTCRLPDGSLAATTRPDGDVVIENKSAFYLPRKGPDTVTLTAGPQQDDPKKDRVSFEDEIMKRLSGSLAGLHNGEQVILELQAERYPAVAPKERSVQMAKVRKRQKELRLSLDEFKTRTGKAAEIGARLVIDPLFPGTVVEVTDTQVVVRFAPAQDRPLALPFGPVTVRETATHYELVIDAVKGHLVRTGGMVGRISDVQGDLFEIDYGHPFGGEVLKCEMAVADVKVGSVAEPAATPAVVEKTVAVTDVSPAAPGATTLDPEAEMVFSKGLATMLAQSTRSGEPARSGDLVTANYTVTLEDGTLVATTLKDVALDPAVKRATWYTEPAAYAPLELVAGTQEVMPGLGEALVGMKAGGKQRISLTADRAFGTPDPKKMQQLPLSQSFPATIRMPVDEYVKLFSAFPVQGKLVELLPYFKSRVTEVTEKDVALEFVVEDGAVFQDSFGSVRVAMFAGTITITTQPRIGATFQFKESTGIITSADGTTFTVDFNHPLAGRTVVLDLEAVSVAASATGGSLDWVDEHDAGLARGRKEGKPVFLILHADWCSWCKKSFSETFPDPRITALRDRFVWVRVNSDKEAKYKKQYAQEGFPMMVLLGADGSILKKIEGYRDARALREEIRAVLN